MEDLVTYIRYGYQQGVIDTYNAIEEAVTCASDEEMSCNDLSQLLANKIMELHQSAELKSTEMMVDLLTEAKQELDV